MVLRGFPVGHRVSFSRLFGYPLPVGTTFQMVKDQMDVSFDRADKTVNSKFKMDFKGRYKTFWKFRVIHRRLGFTGTLDLPIPDKQPGEKVVDRKG